MNAVLELLQHFFEETWLLTATMATLLLLGFAVAGLLSVFISPTWLERHLGRPGLASVFKASLFGVPLPLCSCGVIPVAASLRQHGASRAATTAFLLSTPQTGVDSIMITWTMLGPLFAIFRPIVALLTGILGGGLVQSFVPEDTAAGVEAAAQVDDRPTTWVGRMIAAWTYATVTLPADIGRALFYGILIAGLIATVVPENFLSGYLGAGALSIALMMIVGIPIYVCATASVPLAVGLIAMGATPGAVLAFLVAGPATNAATITTINRVLGSRTMVIYLITVAVSAFGGGLLLDWLLPRAAEAIPRLSGLAHEHGGVGWFEHLGGVALVVVLLWSWWRSRQEEDCCASAECDPSAAVRGTETVFEVVGMTCSHCATSVERAVNEVAGVTSNRVRLDGGLVHVSGDDVSADAIIAAIDGLGYRAQKRLL